MSEGCSLLVGDLEKGLCPFPQKIFDNFIWKGCILAYSGVLEFIIRHLVYTSHHMWTNDEFFVHV
jgi:hypothetical protein